MTKVLILDTDFSGEIKKCKVENGILKLKDMEFFINDAIPFRVKSFFSYDNLYICKWNSLVGAEFELNKKIIKREELDKFLNENFDENQIKEIKKRIEDYEKKENVKITAFEYKTIVPIVPKLIETKKLPELLKQTGNIRFIKEMMKYGGGRSGFDIGIGKIFIIIFVILFAFILLYGFLMRGG